MAISDSRPTTSSGPLSEEEGTQVAHSIHDHDTEKYEREDRNEKYDEDRHDEKREEDRYSVDEVPPTSTPPQGPQHGDDFPDGGLRAWLVVIGAMCNTFSTFGFVNSWGTFQAYYENNLLSHETPSNIAWIGSIQYSLIFLPAVVVGRLFDLGYFRSVTLSASCLLVASTFLVAQCTEYWHFLLCQGIAAGLACGGIFGPTTAVIAHWFKYKRGLAMGFVAVGSSIGGTLLPIAVRNLIPKVGFPWTMRILGFILLVSTGSAQLTVRRRLPPRNVHGGLFNPKAFKYAPYTIFCLSAFICFLGLYTVLTYISASALQSGFPSDLSFYLLSIANAASLFGRFTSGVLADKLGAANVMIPFTAAAGVLTYAWPFAQSHAALIVVAIIYGFSSGAYVALLSNPVMELGETGDLGRRLGMFMTIFSMGALAGPPISGAIETASGGFKVVGYYAGSMVMVAVALMILTRQLVLKRWIGKF